MPHWTSYIEKPDALKMFKAAYKSKEIGFPFNLYLTLNLEQMGFDVLECHYQWAKIRQRLKRFLVRHNQPLVCLWVFENSTTNGLHVHSLLYFKNLTKPNIRKALKIPSATYETVKLERLYSQQTWDKNIHNLTNYFLKGIRPEHAGLITREALSQGEIPGKRVSWTKNIKP
ncbi:hypothetical protein [Terasakiella pusilla]|uniref:hypothetical protein n=1 Tax=Terasakiella pusilla TaxID=64973 RepID=UPI003AA7DA60